MLIRDIPAYWMPRLKRGMTIEGRDSALSRRDAPEFEHEHCPSKREGAGKAGCPPHPQPRVQSVESTRVRHHRFAGTPGLPCAMVLTVSSALSPVTGLCCHRRWLSCLCQLDASVGASGPHGFAVRAQRHSSLTCRVHRIPHQTSVTIAIRPSSEDGMANQ